MTEIDSKEPIVLFVDDEANILKTLQRLFLDEEYDIYTANSGKEALELIDSGVKPTVIVSDQRMPEMGGAEFLQKAKEKVPESIRMVLTGYADINAAMDAVNLGGIYRYIMKPWNDQDLKMSVNEAIQRFNLVAENKRLTEELHEKNTILSEINKNLEEKVLERTKEIRYKVKELEGRDKIQQQLISMHPLEETLQVVAEVILEVIQPAWIAFYLVDKEKVKMARQLIAPDEIVIRDEAVQEILDHVFTNKEAKGAKLTEVFGTGSDLQDSTVGALPIMAAETLYGTLVIGSQSDSGFNKTQLRSLTGFCDQAAIAIKDAEAVENIPDISDALDDLLHDFTDK